MKESTSDQVPLWRRAEKRWERTGADPARPPGHLNAERIFMGELRPGDLPTIGRRSTNWVRALIRFEDFTRCEGRTPRENTRVRGSIPSPERRLGEWARYQRRFEDGLSAYQRARLDVSPYFEWDIGESTWKSRFDACVRFRLKHGRLPVLTKRDDEEFSLARWLGRQLRALQLGMLGAERASRLEKLLKLDI